MSSDLPLFVVDAFASRPFAGNPAAVCLLDRERETHWLQAVAAEMNLSETAFVIANGDDFGLRWFTPTIEVDLCGHATLASAHVLWQEGRASRTEAIRFRTCSGVLTATPRNDEIELDFPATLPEPAEASPGLLDALGVEATAVGRSRFDILVQVATESIVRALRPDFAALRGVAVRGIIVTAPSDDPSFDFVSRFFAPGSGIDEDPVTGSAHCCLGPYWSKPLGKTDLVGHQVSLRGGIVGVALRGDRVLLRGRAIAVTAGRLLA